MWWGFFSPSLPLIPGLETELLSKGKKKREIERFCLDTPGELGSVRGVPVFGGSGWGRPRRCWGAAGGPRGRGPVVEEAGDNREQDLPRPPARLRWPNPGSRTRDPGARALRGKGARGVGVRHPGRHLARPWGPPRGARAPGAVGEGRGIWRPFRPGGEAPHPGAEGRP